jgi:hypothetical protein
MVFLYPYNVKVLANSSHTISLIRSLYERGIMNKILPIFATILAVAIAAAAIVVVTPMAYAQSTSTTTFSFSQDLSNNCSGAGNCSNTGAITFSVTRP